MSRKNQSMTLTEDRQSIIQYRMAHPSKTASEIGKELGLTKDAVQKVLKRSGLGPKQAERPTVRVPKTFSLKGDALIVGDAHSYTVSYKLVEEAVKRAKAAGVNQVILAGDAFCFDRYSKYPSISGDSPLTKELAAARAIITDLMDVGEVIKWIRSCQSISPSRSSGWFPRFCATVGTQQRWCRRSPSGWLRQ